MSTINNKKIEYFNLAKKKLYYKENPIKFIEECVNLPEAGGSRLITLYEPQKKIIKEFFTNNFLILLKSRQLGFSTLSQAIVTYITTFYENCIIGVISRDQPESSDFCRKVQAMIDGLPDWIKPKYKNKSATFFILENGCGLYTSAVSPANPGAVFRSKSITFLIVDEAAHIRHISEAWTGVVPTLSVTQKVAKEKKIPYGIIILSTPNKTQGIGRWFFTMWSNALKNKNGYKPFKIHWKEIDQLRNDPDWYRKQCDLLNNDEDRIAQELELQFVGSESSLFRKEVQTVLNENNTQPIEIVKLPEPIDRFGELWKFKHIKKTAMHLIAVDSASGTGEDFAAVEVLEYQTMDQVLEYHGLLSPKKLADVVRFIYNLCPHNCIIIENSGGYGLAVIEELLEDNIDYNLYGTMKGTKDSKVFIPGLSTNAKTRPLMLESLYNYIKEDPYLIKSQRLCVELLGLAKKGDRIAADEGFHDDLAMAYAFCCYIRKYCTEEIGNIDSVTREEIDKLMVTSGLNNLKLINNGIPLVGYRNMAINGQTINIKEKVDKYVMDKVRSGELTGYIDVFSLFGESINGPQGNPYLRIS